MGHSEEYYQILKQSKNWPNWKIQAYNNYIAISAHAKKLREEN